MNANIIGPTLSRSLYTRNRPVHVKQRFLSESMDTAINGDGENEEESGGGGGGMRGKAEILKFEKLKLWKRKMSKVRTDAFLNRGQFKTIPNMATQCRRWP